MNIRFLFALSTTVLAVACASGEKAQQSNTSSIVTEEIEYTIDGKKHIGFVARPTSTEQNRPGVLVVHEWWGQTEYPRRRAMMLAELGYVAMAADMYGDRKVLEHPKDAGQFAGQTMKDSKTVGSRLLGAMKTLQSLPGVASDKLAAVGYCFGGGVVIEAAKQGFPLSGVVSFHGSLDTPTAPKKGNIQAKMLILNGADDSFISEKSIQNFKQTMQKAGADFKFVSLNGALHGFSNPEATENGKKFGIPLAYNEKADQESWQMMKEFLVEVFQ